jgi:hypothetical protein
MKMLMVFFRVCLKVGFNRLTGWLYWKMFFTVLFKNPKAIEAAISLAAMYIHFHKQSKYIIEQTHKEINYIKNLGETNYISLKLFKSDNHNILHK